MILSVLDIFPLAVLLQNCFAKEKRFKMGFHSFKIFFSQQVSLWDIFFSKSPMFATQSLCGT